MKNLLATLQVTALTLVVCALLYPLAVLAIAQTFFPENAGGSLVRDDEGRIVGSRLIAQKFASDRYFWPRPSAVDFHAAGSGGSNLAPGNPALAARLESIYPAYSLPAGTRLPADLVTASGSGLDPHISEAAALLQSTRVAAARGESDADVRAAIEAHAFAPDWFRSSRRIVNVLELNRALDASNRTPTR